MAACAFATLLVADIAPAQEETDGEILAFCLAHMPPLLASDRCLGTVAAACRNSGATAAECARREALAWEAELTGFALPLALDRAAGRDEAAERRPADGFTGALRAAQTAWADYAEAHCAAEAIRRAGQAGGS